MFLNRKHIMDRARISAHWVSCLTFGGMKRKGVEKAKMAFYLYATEITSFRTRCTPMSMRRSIYYSYLHYIHWHIAHTQPQSDTNTFIYMYIKYTPKIRTFRSFRYEIRRRYLLYLYQTTTATWFQV